MWIEKICGKNLGQECETLIIQENRDGGNNVYIPKATTKNVEKLIDKLSEDKACAVMTESE